MRARERKVRSRAFYYQEGKMERGDRRNDARQQEVRRYKPADPPPSQNQENEAPEQKTIIVTEQLVREEKKIPAAPAIKEYDLSIGHPEAIVIHCNDPRFQGAIDQFIHEELGLATGKYIPVVIPGATASFSEPLTYPKEFKVVSDIISLFLGKHDSIKLIILINHEDCKKYEHMQEKLGNQFLRAAGSVLNRQKIDLSKVAKILLGLAKSKMSIRLFYAKFANSEHTKTIFEEIAR